MSQVTLFSNDDLLNALPDDEFKLVLRYLPLQAKKNLKQTSKTNEKRVMCLDPGMRNLDVVIDETNWVEQGMALAKARIRHILDGTIQDINLTLRFRSGIENESEEFYSVLFLMDSILNSWKDNIVRLDFRISGHEIFLLDPGLKMPQLKDLRVNSTDMDLHHHISKIDEIISVVLDRHKDTLGHLYLGDFYFDENLHLKLKLKSLQLTSFTAHSLSYRDIIDLLEGSQLSLEYLECHNPDGSFEEDEINMMQSLKLNLKQFMAIGTNSSFVSLVIKSASLTLRQVNLGRINNEGVLELEETQLKLTSLVASVIPLEIIFAIIKASQSSLRKLEIKELSIEDTNTDSFFEIIKQTELNSLSAGFISTGFVSSLLQSTRPSLKELTLGCIDTAYFEEDEWQIGKINRMELKGLKKFTSVNNSTRLTSAIINASHATLQSLDISGFYPDPIHQYEMFVLSQDKLHLKKLICNDIPTVVACKIVNCCHSSLEHLEVHKVGRHEVEKMYYDLTSEKMNLTKFSCSEIDVFFVNRIMMLSHLTLEYVCFKGISYGDWSGKFDLGQMSLRLKNFDGKCIDIEMVTAILKSSISWFNAIKLREIDQQNSMKFNPELAKLLIHVKFQNPYCVMDI